MSHSPPIRIRRRTAPPRSDTYIVSVGVERLFGKYDYKNIPVNSSEAPQSRVAVVYGDNGTGKTTILRLIYACLSPESNRGLRNLLANTPFISFRILISDQTSIVVTKKELTGSYDFIIKHLNSEASFRVERGPDGLVQEQKSVSGIEAAIRRLGFDVLFVDHNRSVRSTYAFLSELPLRQIKDVSDIDRREVIVSNIQYLSHDNRLFNERELRFPLRPVVDTLERWFRTQAFQQGSTGDQNAAAVYLEIAKSLGRDRRKVPHREVTEVIDVPATLSELKLKTQSFIRHGLLSEYPFDQFISIYEGASKVKKGQIANVLVPFLNSIQRRLSALQRIHNLINIFEREISNYFLDKSASFHILDGLKIFDKGREIEMDALSSGEKQLVFLLCSSALSQSRKCIILIDEPELSLNYKWQRLIASSLSQLSSGGQTQFILASHSIEIITQHVGSSFELVI